VARRPRKGTRAGNGESNCKRAQSRAYLAANHDERIPSRRAWETGLASIHDAEESRNVILPETAIRAIIDRSNEVSAEFGLLVETAAVTGARISQLARLREEDLQDARSDPRLMMPSSRKGRGREEDCTAPGANPSRACCKAAQRR
jgi:integrase